MRKKMNALIIALLLLGAACTPAQSSWLNDIFPWAGGNVTPQEWRQVYCSNPDRAVDTLIKTIGVQQTRQLAADGIVDCTPAHWVDLGHGVKGPPILLEIRRCESGGDYSIRNPSSSAGGAYQMLKSTWRTWVGHGPYAAADPFPLNGSEAGAPYARAEHAPPHIQDRVAVAGFMVYGTAPWNASRHCWG